MIIEKISNIEEKQRLMEINPDAEDMNWVDERFNEQFIEVEFKFDVVMKVNESGDSYLMKATIYNEKKLPVLIITWVNLFQLVLQVVNDIEFGDEFHEWEYLSEVAFHYFVNHVSERMDNCEQCLVWRLLLAQVNNFNIKVMGLDRIIDIRVNPESIKKYEFNTELLKLVGCILKAY